MNCKILPFLFCLTTLFVSCTEEPDDEPTGQDTLIKSTGIYVMNEGLYNGNNASITRFAFSDSSVAADLFLQQNGRGLGDTGSDLAIYGSKMYAIVNISSQVEVMDARTCMSLRQIPLFNDNLPRQPRKIAFYGSKAFVCNFDGTVAVIDTISLQIEKLITVGPNPDGITVAGGRIWVSNSGGLNFPDYNNTLSIIDPVSLIEQKQVTVGTNPFVMASDNYGDLYVIVRGNYGNVKSHLQVIDIASGNVKQTFNDFETINFSLAGDTAYVYNYDWGTGISSVMMLNVKTETMIRSSFITDGTVLQTVYGIAADPVSGLVYISDAGNFTGMGKVYAFNKSGKLKFSFEAGLNPAVFAFLHEKVMTSKSGNR
jgi:hypothetical protein